jgi:hypothetical protein
MALTLTMKKNGEATPAVTPMKRQPPVLFTSRSDHFDLEQCESEMEFTVNPNEQHVLLPTNLKWRIPRVLLDDAGTVRINNGQSGHILGYCISLKQPDMMLTVGPKTPLSLLINSGYLDVVPFFVTCDQYMLLV